MHFEDTYVDLKHFTVLADGIVGELRENYDCRPGRAFMSIKVWAVNSSMSIDMACAIGEHVGFFVDGEVETYATDPESPSQQRPFGYDIKFSPYDEEHA